MSNDAVKFSTYRPEIDGLRAVAVLAVVFYHFQLFGLQGGFTGVDVFFVISGYLIGGLLWQERAGGRFSLSAFWLRRIRRLAPAYLTMGLAVVACGWWLLLPFDLSQLGREGVAATLWVANIQFWRGSGYFDSGEEVKPLLHMWSLSVEEQFYIVLPLLVWGLLRRPRALVAVLAAGWAVSLLGNLWVTGISQTTAFFLFPFRAWEMLTGVLLAILQLQKPAARLPSGAAWTGLALILGGILWIPASGHFPGTLALVPVLGTGLVLASRPVGLWVAVMSWRPLVFVGLISYALYLWHWPVRVFGRYIFDITGFLPNLVGVIVSFALAILSWAVIERPIRHAKWITNRQMLAGFVAASALLLGLSFNLWRSGGAPDRFAADDALVHIQASQDFVQDDSRCFTARSGPLQGVQQCAIGPEDPPKVVVWGDSHLRALMEGLALAASRTQTPGILLWHAGCPPLAGLRKTETAATPAQDEACALATQTRIAAIKALAPQVLLLVGRWSYYAEGAGSGLDAHNKITLHGDYDQAWAQTLTELSPFVGRIAVLRQVPEIPQYDSRQIARGMVHGRLSAAQAQDLGRIDAVLAATRMTAAEAPILALRDKIAWLDPWPWLCDPDCRAVQGGLGLYFDNNHLTNQGARHLAPLFQPLFKGGADVGF